MQTTNQTSPTTATTTPSKAPANPAKARTTRKGGKAKAKGRKPAKVVDTKRHESKAGIESPVAAVHLYLHKHGKGQRRRDALAALDAKGIAYYTVRTQYQRWFADPKASVAKYGKGKKAA